MSFKAYITEFLAHLTYERHLSEHTVKSYQSDLTQLQQFLATLEQSLNPQTESLDVDVQQIDKSLIHAFLGHLHAQQQQKSTIARKVAALKTFFAFLHKRGYLAHDPARHLPTPRIPDRLPPVVSADDMAKLLETIQGVDVLTVRDLAMLELLYATGIRASELTRLQVADLHLRERWLKVRGKGGKERVVIMGEPAVKALQHYLTRRLELVSSTVAAAQAQPRQETVFLNYQGGALSTRSVRRIVKKYVQREHLDAGLSPHAFRHAFATHLLDAGADLRVIQELLGHENLSTTQRYTHVGIKQLITTYNRTHPKAKCEKEEVKNSPLGDGS